MRNLDIRIMIKDNGLTYKAVASQMGISAVWLSTILRYDLSVENREKILKAVRELRDNNGES